MNVFDGFCMFLHGFGMVFAVISMHRRSGWFLLGVYSTWRGIRGLAVPGGSGATIRSGDPWVGGAAF